MATQRTQMHARPVRSPRPSPRLELQAATRLEPQVFSRSRPDRGVAVRPIDPRRRALYCRRRATAVAFVLLLVAAILTLTFVGGRATADGSSPGEIRPAAVYVVRPGDTLWDLAVALAPDRDPRVVVAALERSAGGSTVRPGQRIVLPASLQ
ncbi:MAG: LysM peptidoglycan-binding domain-containing protein [Acidimicrobiales bacterium]